MKYKSVKSVCLAAFLMASHNAFAEESALQEGGKPLSVVTSDGKERTISDCKQFTFLRLNDLKISKINGLSDPDWIDAKNSLTGCYIDWYVKENKLTLDNTAKTPNIKDVLSHFPASEAYFVNKDEQAKIKKNSSGKSILEYTPSLKINDRKMISDKEGVSYSVWWFASYKNENGDLVSFITIGSGVTQGTKSILKSYIIKSTQGKIWDVKELDENSPI
ncbi:hypothetical protein ASE93_12430 [Serratia sp. Leaf50]|nr:hypothetical protein ASE93_12430 [Serratia sp. Leaf50]